MYCNYNAHQANPENDYKRIQVRKKIMQILKVHDNHGKANSSKSYRQQTTGTTGGAAGIVDMQCKSFRNKGNIHMAL